MCVTVLTELVALAALAAALSGVIMYMKDRKAVYSLVATAQEAVTHPELLGKALASAYPPADVAGIINAVVEAQKPSVLNFIETEGIPLMAAIGGGQVAEDARLARAAKKLGGGASGLQGLMGLISAPSKKSGVGDLLAYLPVIREFMQHQGGNGQGALPGPAKQAGVNWDSYR